MVQFDINQAVTLTVSGVAAAFVALIALILFTILVRRVEQLTNRTHSKVLESASVAPSEAPGRPSGDDLPDDDAELAAVAASAVAISLLDEEEMMVAGRQAAAASVGTIGGKTGEEGWKGYGRWQAFNSRNLRNRGR